MWTPSRLRHTRGVLTCRHYGKDGSQAQMGHLRPETTDIYTSEVLDELARKVVRESS